MNNIRKIIEERLENAQIDLKCNINLSVEDVRVLQGQIEAYQDCLNLIPTPRTEQDLERLEQLEIENRNNEKVVADGVKLLNRNLELQSRLEALEKENKALRNGIDLDLNAKLLSENEKFKKAIIDILEYVKCELDSIEIVDRIENILKEVLGE